MTDKKTKVIIISTIILTITILIGLTYTYFAVSVSNSNNEKVQTQTATMSLVFDDNDNGISANLNLGQSITKKFTLENTGTVDAYGKINWYNLVNTYTEDSLTWTLEQSTSENGTYMTVGSGKVPTSSTATTAVLKNGLMVPVSTTYYYKLTITLNNLDINQSSDINATMHSKFNLEAGTGSATATIIKLVSGEPSNTTDVITKTAPQGSTCTNTLAYDNTVNNNLRYVGANPCNYAIFNGEDLTKELKWVDREISSETEYDIFETESECTTFLQNNGYTSTDECVQKTVTTGSWRIVGIMNNVDDGAGNLETRIKLVRTDPLGNYSWDSSASEINYGYGINDWTQADLMNELNGDYLNTSLNANTNWYNGTNNSQTGIYDYTKGLKASTQSQIGDAKWYLGGMENTNADLIPSIMYSLERGTKVWGSKLNQTCNDGYCPRATSWTGKVALLYPSDYGFATAGGNTISRNTCIEILSTHENSSEEAWNNPQDNDCVVNNWIFYQRWQWLLSPDSAYYRTALLIYDTGLVAYFYTSTSSAVYPAVYLKTETSITGGNGSQENPYIIG